MAKSNRKANVVEEKSSEFPPEGELPEEDAAEEEAGVDPELLAGPILLPFSAGCAQSMGMQRNSNEDALLVISSTIAWGQTAMPLGLFIVADGMGGQRYGEVASSLAVRTLASFLLRRLFVHVIGPRGAAPEQSIRELLEEGMMDAQRQVQREAPGGGTTLTAILILGDQMTLAHVGDSRAYLVSDEGEVAILSSDHSLVNRLVELGQISSEEAATHPQRHVLYRALGQGDPFEADIRAYPTPHSGKLLLCSDGLWGVLGDQEIARILNTSSDPQTASQELVRAANLAGGPDNVSAVVVKFSA